jgi:hypothetical protein
MSFSIGHLQAARAISIVFQYLKIYCDTPHVFCLRLDIINAFNVLQSKAQGGS